MKNRRIVTATLATAAMATAGTGLALAHAPVKKRYPAPGSSVSSVRTVRITFAEAVVAGKISSISGSHGFSSSLNGDRTVLTAKLKGGLAKGEHTVAWRVRADDGDSERGSWRFRVR